MFSVLHISDLHRSPRYPITNDELISALVGDRERYLREDPPVPAPELIVVSGDLIQGVPLRTRDYISQLTEQYAVAEAFLAELADRFLNGDRARMIIVPGNHDVDWNTSRQAMSLVSVEDAPKDIAAELFREQSLYRWNWSTRELYMIVDKEKYASRLDTFWNFFARFYGSASGLWRVRPHAEANLFRACNDRIGIAAFNSCYANDCFALHGMIQPSAIGRSCLDMSETGCAFDLHMAVWHHSVEGPPYRTDYMDVDLVRAMAGRGFRLGLHGHQHKAQATPHKVFLPDQETMAVVSAGSLCAGTNELPVGVNRQYNVIEIAASFHSARIHVREMTVGSLFGRAALADFGGRSFADIKWEPPKDLAGRPIDAGAERLRATIERAEEHFKSGDSAASARLLAPLRAVLSGYGRQLLLDSAANVPDWNIVLEITTTPLSIEELVRRVEAFVRLRGFDGAREAIDQFARLLNLDSATEHELRAKVAAEEALHK